jgi:hypothetical protein
MLARLQAVLDQVSSKMRSSIESGVISTTLPSKACKTEGCSTLGSWRDGRPIAERDEVFNFLKIPREGEPDVDLIGELEKLKTKIVQKADGTIDSTVIREVIGGAEPIAPTRGSSQARRFKAEFQAQEQAKKMAPRLVAGGYRYVADTEYIRAFVVVTNQGLTASRGTSARGEFIDWFGKPFAVHTLPVPPLEPGESQEMTFFSMVRKDEANEKADKYRSSLGRH